MSGIDYVYKAELVRVIDGDTIDFNLDLGFHISQLTRIRVRNFDAPEIRGIEKPEGLIVKAEVELMLEHADEIIVHTGRDTSFNRWVGDIYVNGMDLKELLRWSKQQHFGWYSHWCG